jgi:hypothetical protein
MACLLHGVGCCTNSVDALQSLKSAAAAPVVRCLLQRCSSVISVVCISLCGSKRLLWHDAASARLAANPQDMQLACRHCLLPLKRFMHCTVLLLHSTARCDIIADVALQSQRQQAAAAAAAAGAADDGEVFSSSWPQPASGPLMPVACCRTIT